jgi:uncharacterized protein (TIGR02246 family)
MLSDADRREISELLTAYAHAVDRRDFELLAAVFTADGVLDTGRGIRTGLTEIRTAMERLHRYDATFHMLGQSRVAGGPDTASGETYCDAHHLLVEPAEGGERRTDTVMKIRYADDFVRTDDGWRIAVRRLHTDWTEQRRID